MERETRGAAALEFDAMRAVLQPPEDGDEGEE